jgi:hypothetical protein
VHKYLPLPPKTFSSLKPKILWVAESNLSALQNYQQPKRLTGFYQSNNTSKKSKLKKVPLGLNKGMLSSDKCAKDMEFP